MDGIQWLQASVLILHQTSRLLPNSTIQHRDDDKFVLEEVCELIGGINFACIHRKLINLRKRQRRGDDFSCPLLRIINDGSG